ncbi:MAG: fibronectin type III domain-containing protein [Helicobacteraceae bacterium]|jgi:hypothetical protein|nr:fibronectin type III domain-containing protein [Helicobacteraceae bacterium]
MTIIEKLGGVFLPIVAAVVMTACSSSSDDGAAVTGDESPATPSGVFIDSVVQGLDYDCQPSGLSGKTDAEGKYAFETDDMCTFSIVGITLGTAKGKSVITPLDLLATFTYNELANKLVFLQALDGDGDPENGIDLSNTLSGSVDREWDIAPVDFYVGLDEFLWFSNGIQREIDDQDAMKHFYASTTPYFQTLLDETMFNGKMLSWRDSAQIIFKDDATYELMTFDQTVAEVCTGSWNVSETKLMLTQEKCDGVSEADTAEIDFMTVPAADTFFRVKAGSSDPYDYQFVKIETMTDAVVPNAAPTITAGIAPATSSSLSIAWNRVPTATGYNLSYNKTGDFSGLQLSTYYAANTVTANISGLDKATTYYFQMRARNTMGVSAVSEDYNATTLQTIPAAPSNLHQYEYQIFNWNDNSDNEENFVLQFCSSAECTTESFEMVTADTTTYDVWIATGSTIYIRVKAVNSIGDSAYSNQVEFTRDW